MKAGSTSWHSATPLLQMHTHTTGFPFTLPYASSVLASILHRKQQYYLTHPTQISS
jgi:hypothetical protein